MKWLNEVELEEEIVKMIPMRISHQEELVKAASDGELWNIWYTSVPSKVNISSYMNYAMQEYQKDGALPFVVIDKPTNKVIGSTRYCNAVPKFKRLEIGYTWYAQSYQRTGINTACKYLLLSHAFETLDCIAVEFRTNFHNAASRAAISRIGAKQDGVLRNHGVDIGGVFRDTVVFSIVRDEWPAVKKLLTYKMNR